MGNFRMSDSAPLYALMIVVAGFAAVAGAIYLVVTMIAALEVTVLAPAGAILFAGWIISRIRWHRGAL